MIALTELEQEFLKKWVELEYLCDMQLFGIEDVSENVNRDRGVLGSLEKKHILYSDSDGISNYVSDEAIETIRQYTGYIYENGWFTKEETK